jgi:hypothetical protein
VASSASGGCTVFKLWNLGRLKLQIREQSAQEPGGSNTPADPSQDRKRYPIQVFLKSERGGHPLQYDKEEQVTAPKCSTIFLPKPLLLKMSLRLAFLLALTTVCAARERSFCPTDPFLDPFHDVCNPLRYKPCSFNGPLDN